MCWKKGIAINMTVIEDTIHSFSTNTTFQKLDPWTGLKTRSFERAQLIGTFPLPST
jgi:hypothetical protein